MTDSPQQLVTVSVVDGIGTITLDSPHNRNALSTRLVAQLHEAFDAAEADDAAKVIVLTHTGGTFCAGADLSEASHAESADPVRERALELIDLLERILRSPKPVIARINGHVRAGGMGLITACDFAVAGPACSFALTEARLGLAASAISLTVAPRLSDREAARLFLTGTVIDGPRAAEVGLVTDAGDDVDALVDALTVDLLKQAPQGLAETKALLNHHLIERFAADRDRLADQSSRLFASEAAQQAIMAFLTRKK